MLDYQKLERLGQECGFTHVAPLAVSTIRLLPEVREMCQRNSCGKYGKNWSCPPGCGTLEECRDRVNHFQEGILVQTVGTLEDELDGEGMMEAEAKHKANFRRMHDALRKQYPGLLALGAGCCTLCSACTYPDAPCRFPERQISSMESYGMLVTEICRANHMEYYYGPCSIAYTSCFLLPEPL